MFVAIGCSYTTPSSEVTVHRLHLPRDFNPTDTNRAWFNGVSGHVDTWVPFAAFLTAIPITTLFFIDQNFSCILSQQADMGMVKGAYYHSSFLLVGLFNMIFPLFRCPFVTASLPHSPQFVQALTEKDRSIEEEPREDRGRIEGGPKVCENRIAPTLMYLLCLLALAVPAVLDTIPVGCAYGILTFVGLAGILPNTGNKFVDRVLLLMTSRESFPAEYDGLRTAKIHAYTLIQCTCLLACWTWQFTGTVTLAFPLIIVLFVPLHRRGLVRLFTTVELSVLDPSFVREGSEC